MAIGFDIQLALLFRTGFLGFALSTHFEHTGYWRSGSANYWLRAFMHQL